jgi:hypothetical protein
MPLLTSSGEGPCQGVCGYVGVAVQATSCHSRFGKVAVKHPLFGRGTCVIFVCQLS